MPNHITQVLNISGPHTEDVVDFIISEGPRLDFNKVVPMPEELDITSTISPKDPVLAEKYRENKEKYGHETWYDWCVEHWGTKWNSYNVLGPSKEHDDSMEICFQTAWSPPFPVIKELSKKFPTTKFSLKYFDEGWNFAGTAKFSMGNCEDETFKPDVETLNAYTDVYDWEKNHEPV